jgi:NAD(P)-dependent dehydrogenase (short-subunit alcohol dehydrogenase family)
MTAGRGRSSTSRQLAGKVALITGAAFGAGRAAAELFAEQGAAIVVVDVNDDGAHETTARIEKDGGRATAVLADVSRRSDCEAMIAAATASYGRLDVLYNSATIRVPARLVDTTEEMWDATIATNLSAVYWACRAAIPSMLAGGGGSIVNSSWALGRPRATGFAACRAADAGLIALTRQIAGEHRPAIRAHVIEPGSSDGAEVALFLAGDGSANTTGAVIPCDAGPTALR